MAKHTPGPWHVARSGLNVRVYSGRQVVAACSPEASPAANARLIAAAPTMLRALKAADALLATTEYRDGDVHGIVRAAIAQAEAE